MKLSWSEAESKAQDRAEYRRQPVLRQELKGKEEEEVFAVQINQLINLLRLTHFIPVKESGVSGILKVWTTGYPAFQVLQDIPQCGFKQTFAILPLGSISHTRI